MTDKPTGVDPGLDDDQGSRGSGLVIERALRLERVETLRDMGYEPYPATAERSHSASELLAAFTGLMERSESVVVAGRLRHLRDFGQLIFADLRDESGRIQLMIDVSNISPAQPDEQRLGFEEIKDLIDPGDHVGATGTLMVTDKGERSVLVNELRLYSKALRRLPYRMDDAGDRIRRRYVELAIDDDVRARFERRSRFWDAHRRFFAEHGFLEMNIPVLEHTTGGADANPFVTRMDTIDTEFYLRISQELYLKRLIGGGYERVFEIGPRFRNEGISEEHLPEHIAMEFYWAYADYRDAMNFVRDMFRFVARDVWGHQRFTIRGFDVDLAQDWEIIEFATIIEERYGVDVFDVSLDAVRETLVDHGIDFDDETINVSRGIDLLWKAVRRTIGGPAFMIHEPTFLSPLAKVCDHDPRITQRFHPLIGGSELGNGYSELNDPVEQFERFREQQGLRDQGDDEAQMLDIDFIEMLEYGMPPTAGYGHSERNFWFFEDVAAREGVPFPQTKHFVNPVNREIYPGVELESNRYRAHRLRPF